MTGQKAAGAAGVFCQLRPGVVLLRIADSGAIRSMGCSSFKPIQNIGLHIKSLFLEVCVKETGGLGHADEAEGDQKHYKVVKTPAQGKRQPLNLCIRLAAQLCNQAVNKDQYGADDNDTPRRPCDSGKGAGASAVSASGRKLTKVLRR